MSLFNMVSDYVEDTETARKALFEAAMIERIGPNGPGYKISDMLYDLCDAQARIVALENAFDLLEARIAKKAPKSRAKGA